MPTYLSDDKKSSLYTFHIATAYYKLKKYQEAIDKLNEGLMLNSRNAMAYNVKGLGLMNLGRNYEAVECFDNALEIDPNLASAWMHKGNAMEYLQNHKK